VGGGAVALDKGRALHAAGALLHVVAPTVDDRLAALAASVERRPFAPPDVDGVWLAVSAATPEVNRAVKQAGDGRHVFVIAVDDVASCSAIGAAQLRRGPLTVAISSDGHAPALVSLLRKALEALLVDDVATWAAVAQKARLSWKAHGTPIPKRAPLLLSTLNALYASPEAAP